MIPVFAFPPAGSGPLGGGLAPPASAPEGESPADAFGELLSILSAVGTPAPGQVATLPVATNPLQDDTGSTKSKPPLAEAQESSPSVEDLGADLTALQLLLAAALQPPGNEAPPPPATASTDAGDSSADAAPWASAVSAASGPSLQGVEARAGAAAAGMGVPADPASAAASQPIEAGATAPEPASTGRGGKEIDPPRGTESQVRDIGSPEGRKGAAAEPILISPAPRPGERSSRPAQVSQPTTVPRESGETTWSEQEQGGQDPMLHAGVGSDTQTQATGTTVRASNDRQPPPAPERPEAPEGTGASRVASPPAGASARHESEREDEDRRRPSAPVPWDLTRGVERAEGVFGGGETAAARGPHDVALVREPLTQAGLDRVASAAHTSFSRGGMEVRLRLHPESLGEVRVQVRWENGVLSARLETASSTARDALQSSAPAHLTVSIRMDLETRSSSQDPGTQAGQGSPSDPASPAQSALRAEPEGETVPAGRVDVRI
jgi:hypothetical protein